MPVWIGAAPVLPAAVALAAPEATPEATLEAPVAVGVVEPEAEPEAALDPLAAPEVGVALGEFVHAAEVGTETPCAPQRSTANLIVARLICIRRCLIN